MPLVNLTRKNVLAENYFVADNIFTRMKGLLGKKELLVGEALVIKPCNAVHTFFMRFTIDVLFLDRSNKVVKILPKLVPFKISPICFAAYAVVELPSGIIESTQTKLSDTISFE